MVALKQEFASNCNSTIYLGSSRSFSTKDIVKSAIDKLRG